ncbi:MAG: hypothetical protein QGI86_07845 [Candidatus Poribacteria bacterium]|nr:hypothetical protein [Candidatus Poribacteria bacterium]MDP6749527.1 hypothetical protein [Candidatus Poribacteria bacterium]
MVGGRSIESQSETEFIARTPDGQTSNNSVLRRPYGIGLPLSPTLTPGRTNISVLLGLYGKVRLSLPPIEAVFDQFYQSVSFSLARVIDCVMMIKIGL